MKYWNRVVKIQTDLLKPIKNLTYDTPWAINKIQMVDPVSLPNQSN